MNQTTVSAVINPIVVRIALDCGEVVSAETARVREVLVRRMGWNSCPWASLGEKSAHVGVAKLG
jgi:hypothetical protein